MIKRYLGAFQALVTVDRKRSGGGEIWVEVQAIFRKHKPHVELWGRCPAVWRAIGRVKNVPSNTINFKYWQVFVPERHSRTVRCYRKDLNKKMKWNRTTGRNIKRSILNTGVTLLVPPISRGICLWPQLCGRDTIRKSAAHEAWKCAEGKGSSDEARSCWTKGTRTRILCDASVLIVPVSSCDGFIRIL